MAAVADRLGEHRLVTLVGPGGAGKTRLAGEVGAAIADRFRDGVWLVELAGVTDPDDVVGAAVGTLGVREAALFDTRSTGARRGPLDQLHDALNDRDLLLILDNCEHVLDAVAELVEYLLTRMPAAADPDHEPRIPCPAWGISLSGTPARATAATARRSRCSSTAPGPSDPPPVDDLPAVEEICRRLDGLPLAIELAAARTRGPDRAPDRRPAQRSVPAAVRWQPGGGGPAPHAAGRRGMELEPAHRRTSGGCWNSCPSSPAARASRAPTRSGPRPGGPATPSTCWPRWSTNPCCSW